LQGNWPSQQLGGEAEHTSSTKFPPFNGPRQDAGFCNTL